MILDPLRPNLPGLDARSREIVRRPIDFFEAKGKKRLREDDHDARLVRRLPRVRQARADLRRPADARRRTAATRTRAGTPARICAFNEILGFYGLAYWYTWQVSILGLGPIWRARTRRAKRGPRELLEDGGDLRLRPLREGARRRHLLDRHDARRPDGDGGFRANGGKYYIGNGNVAGMVSVFGRCAGTRRVRLLRRRPAARRLPAGQERRQRARPTSPSSSSTTTRSRPSDVLHTRPRRLRRRAQHGQRRQVQPRLRLDRHLRARLLRGDHTTPRSRVLYGMHVTDFPHVRADVHRRLRAPGRDEALRAARAIDYMRSASPEDRRYLLYNPITKMKVTTRGREGDRPPLGRDRRQGLREGHVLRDGGARHPRPAEARGHGPREHGAGPQVHGELPLQPGRATRRCRGDATPADDDFLFRQGPAQGPREDPLPRLARRPSRGSPTCPNVARFLEQAEGLETLLADRRRPTRSSSKDLDFLLAARRALHARRLRPADPRAGGAHGARTTTPSTRSSTSSCATSRATPCSSTASRRRPRRRPRAASRCSAARPPTRPGSPASGTRRSTPCAASTGCGTDRLE